MESMKKQDGKEENGLYSVDLTDEDLEAARGGMKGKPVMKACPKCQQKFPAEEWEEHVAECKTPAEQGPKMGSRWVF